MIAYVGLNEPNGFGKFDVQVDPAGRGEPGRGRAKKKWEKDVFPKSKYAAGGARPIMSMKTW